MSDDLPYFSKSEQARPRSSADRDAKALKDTEMKVLSNKVRRIVKHLRCLASAPKGMRFCWLKEETKRLWVHQKNRSSNLKLNLVALQL